MVEMDYADRQDFEDADRGLIGSLEPCVVHADDGRVVWDNDAYAFLDGDCPDTANPSLWRQGQLCAKQGLYEVTDGIYQVRGLDLSNMTLVESDNGVIVIDPLISKETAAAALALYRKHRGDRAVTAVIYTHAHGDHFGGVHGVYPGGDVPIVAAEGFMEAAVSENVYAGTAMTRRAEYMYGAQLPKRPEGQIGAGLGMTTSLGHDRADPADALDHPHRPGGDDRRRAHPVPDDARHRVPGGDELLLPRPPARCAWPRTPRTTCTTS